LKVDVRILKGIRFYDITAIDRQRWIVGKRKLKTIKNQVIVVHQNANPNLGINFIIEKLLVALI